MSSGSIPAVRIARIAGDGGHRRRRLVRGRDASLADPGPATIHSSEVSTIRSRSRFVSTCDGA